MRHLQVQTVDELLKNIDKPKLIEAEIIEYVVILRNPLHSLAYQTRHIYLSAIVMFYAINDVNLNRKKIARYRGEPTMVRQDRAYTTEEILILLEFCEERERSYF
jgi:hypothetical protein